MQASRDRHPIVGAHGGKYKLSNLVLAHRKCNSERLTPKKRL